MSAVVNETHDPRKYIEELAYRLWQEAGEPPNSALYFWLEAEKQFERTTGSGRGPKDRQ